MKTKTVIREVMELREAPRDPMRVVRRAVPVFDVEEELLRRVTKRYPIGAGAEYAKIPEEAPRSSSARDYEPSRPHISTLRTRTVRGMASVAADWSIAQDLSHFTVNGGVLGYGGWVDLGGMPVLPHRGFFVEMRPIYDLDYSNLRRGIDEWGAAVQEFRKFVQKTQDDINEALSAEMENTMQVRMYINPAKALRKRKVAHGDVAVEVSEKDMAKLTDAEVELLSEIVQNSESFPLGRGFYMSADGTRISPFSAADLAMVPDVEELDASIDGIKRILAGRLAAQKERAEQIVAEKAAAAAASAAQIAEFVDGTVNEVLRDGPAACLYADANLVWRVLIPVADARLAGVLARAKVLAAERNRERVAKS